MNRLMQLLPIVQGQRWKKTGEHNNIRNRWGQCPLEALASEVIGTRDALMLQCGPGFALRAVGLHENSGYIEVILAADMEDHPARQELEHALGMK